MWWLLALIPLACFGWWFRVHRIRSRFKHAETGQLIAGSNWPPMVDYLFHGFTGRNINAPFGDFELSFPLGFPTLFVSEPKIIKELVTGGGVKDYDKGELVLAGTAPIAGRQNLFSADGAMWQHQRAIINPAFRPKFMALLMSAIVSTVESHMTEWAALGEVGDLSKRLDRLTLDVIFRSAFGSDGGVSVLKDYKKVVDAMLMEMVGLGRLGARKTIAKASEDIDNVARGILASNRARQQNPTEGKENPVSLISLLLAAENLEQTEAGEEEEHVALTPGAARSLTDREIIDNIKIFMFAGHETASSSLCWVIYMLAYHPHYQQKAREEVLALLKGQSLSTLTPESWKSTPFLDKVLKETLRLYSPAWTINRSPKSDLTLGGYTVPKGTAIMINTLRLHRRADLGWERPLEFVPERWDTRENCHKKGSFCYMPFGGGPRACVGQPLAEGEILVVLCALLSQFEFILVGKGKTAQPAINYFGGSTIRPTQLHNIRLRLLAKKA